MFGNISFTEVLIIMVLVLLVFGAKRIPEIASSMGKGIREFKRSISEVDRSLNDIGQEERREPLRRAEPPLQAPKRADDEGSEPKRLMS
ncbi:MAG TPA: twin-arginine translocase TatA/TatE family subunit [Gemmatimonadaceae bacterium]|nr:twin-arginine translocase TatA/TatE family subunit [Gemmatimonadaceae bacterium]